MQMKQFRNIGMYKFFFFAICIVCLLCACSMGDSEGVTNTYKEDEEMILTERQINILEQLGVSTDVQEMTDSQKAGIIAIEEMLVYLESKYNTQFEFVEYVAPGEMEAEMLAAKPAGETLMETVTVIRKNGVCTDDYSKVLIRDDYELVIEAYFEERKDGIKVYSEIADVLDNNEQHSGEALFEIISSSDSVFLDRAFFGEEEFEEIIIQYSEWLQSNLKGTSNCTAIYLCDSQMFHELTRFNYKDLIIKTEFVAYKAISISVSGEVLIF